MVPKRIILTILIVFGLTALPAYSQLESRESGMGLGVVGGVLRGDTDFGRSDDVDLLLRGFLRYHIAGPLSGELGGGYGVIKDKDPSEFYRTRLYPIENRFLFSPFSLKRFNIYAYLGVGTIYYKSEDFPPNSTEGNENSGWTGFVPGGLGIQIGLTDVTAFELNAGYNHTLIDKLEAYEDNKNDGYWSLAAGLSFHWPSGSADPDGDGLTNDQEKELNTDKNNADTDGDGLTDGAEFNKYQSNPLSTDTDGDGLNDYAEVMDYKTNPTKKDTDGDGLDDSAELNQYQTDPLNKDTDGDGLSDGEEVNQYKTNPLKKDSDRDGLSDGAEVNDYKTDPLQADSDGDGLNDGAEANQYKTDPSKADTDGGTINDGEEVQRGTNPLDKSDDVEQPKLLGAGVGVPVILEGIYFELNSAKITPESDQVLDEVVRTLKEFTDVNVEIVGHTDSQGPEDYNMQLSQKRADSVKDFLVQNGIAANRITTRGMGESKPIASNETKAGRQKNRRIEFIRTK
ncbi:MAG: OmpA family protein [Calditrichia bacterium]